MTVKKKGSSESAFIFADGAHLADTSGYSLG